MQEITVRQPETDIEWQQYFELRWRLLRQPWQQPRGSEQDAFEENAIHRAAIIKGKIIAVGRAHFSEPGIANIRYMAVDSAYQNRGIGSKVLISLEQAIDAAGASLILLHAREKAVDFYKAHHYQQIAASHVLFNEIQHFSMKKQLQ